MTNFRSVVERMLRGRILKRTLPPEFGSIPIYVTAEAGLRYVFQSMSYSDPMLLNLAREVVRKGDVVWDIGANIGLFTFAAAHCSGSTGKIVSLEPDIWLLQLMSNTKKLNEGRLAHVELLPAAAAKMMEIRQFVIAQRTRATNHIVGYGSGLMQTGGARSQQPVITITLDWLGQFYPLPNVLKIDVEGAELEVLQGGVSLLSKSRPILICEVANKDTAAQVGELLQGFGYTMFNSDIPLVDRIALDRPAYNTLAIPSTER